MHFKQSNVTITRMGAELWYYEAPWDDDPARALAALQTRIFVENYNLAEVLRASLADARESVSYTQAERDQYEKLDKNKAKVRLLERLLDHYKDEVQLLETLCRQPIPKDPIEQLQILRRVEATGSAEIGNILDVRGVSDRRDTHVAQRLTEDQMIRLVETTRPTTAQSHAAVAAIHSDLNRGESICFPMFADNDKTKPVGWFFVGNTVD
jgi:hypothetical protein